MNRQRESSDSRFILMQLFLLYLFVNVVESVTHWKVNDAGFIEPKTDTPYTILRPYDLASFIKQSDRTLRLREISDLISSKEHINKYGHTKLYVPTSVATYQENFYKTDPDCLRAGQPLTKFQFYETHYNIWRIDDVSFPKEVLQIREEDVPVFKKPNCLAAPLPFNMETFDHLESIADKDLISMAPELELLENIFVDPEDFYGHVIHEALLTNNTSWMYLTMASDYYRLKGDYSNTIKCLQRAIYHVPRAHSALPILSLSNLLHKLHFVNDSLSVALSSLSFDPWSSLFAYHVGNIYVTLGDLNLAFNAYEKAFYFDPLFKQAYAKKHAVLCHLKLEQYLEEQHINLQKKLDEIKEYQVLTEEWIQESASVELEKSSPDRREITQKYYDNHVKNKPSRICTWDQFGKNKMKLACSDLDFHFSMLESLYDLDWLYNESLHSEVKKFPGVSEGFLSTSQMVDSLDQNTCSDKVEMSCSDIQSYSQSESDDSEKVGQKDDEKENDQDEVANENFLSDEIQYAGVWSRSKLIHQTSNKFTSKLLSERSVENRIKIPDYISIF